ncbi:SpoIVB peptidase S55 domain-containing protein [Bryobacter aggregatus]|uniref:SpoIVB peptidase S55 domain-containing protein n=1 Tax=Bryobacter aggregatus TaxID=360054 RepID=UPI0004E1349F|nr:SpoIVB peptidase S55 domain-containing protein [Bryobacter aggregatus]
MRRVLLAFSFVISLAFSQPATLPVSALRPDMPGVALTVFRGQNPEEFPLRILGVLRDTGPGQDIILARLLTSRLELTGVMQGMSGSPVYVDGKLIGAIAFAFPFAKEPICGIRPIAEMLASAPAAMPHAAKLHLGSPQLIATPETPPPAGTAAIPVLTPISLAGFSAATLQYFGPQLQQMGFALQQGVSGNQPTSPASPLRPGDMISVQLLSGDMSAGADGTVTHIAGKQLYAFGHRFFGGGAVDFPFSKAEVITPLPNLNTSFKISQSLQPMGSILFDGDAAVSGELNRFPKLTPLLIRYRDGVTSRDYKIDMVRHTVLSPLLLQMAIFSTVDHHFRSGSTGTIDLKGSIQYPGQPSPLLIEGHYSGDSNLPIAASLGGAIPFAFFQQHSAETLLPESIRFDITAQPARKQWVIDSVSLSRRSAKPGEALVIQTHLTNTDGTERIIDTPFTPPSWLPGGETLTISVLDSFAANLLDFRSFYQAGGPVFRSPAELIQVLNTLHPGNAFYVRVMRSAPAFQSASRDLSNLPPSIAATLQKTPGAYLPTYQSRLIDQETRLPDGVVAGSRTATLEIEK